MGVSWGGDGRRTRSPSSVRADKLEPSANEVIDLREILDVLVDLDVREPVEPAPASFS